MPYIGNTAADRFVASKAASVYSGDGSTVAFTLEHSVGADEDILVSVDGVIQEPSVAYAVSSGTTLTFTAAPSSNSGNNIFVYYLFRTIGTVTHPPTSALSATSGTFSTTLDVTGETTLATHLNLGDSDRIKLGAGSDLQLYHDGTDSYITNATNSLKVDSNAGLSLKIDGFGHVTKPLQPAFLVKPTSTQTNIALATNVTAIFGTEIFDVGSNFASNTFTAPETGKYQLNASLFLQGLNNAYTYIEMYIATSNKSFARHIKPNHIFSADSEFTINLSVLADMDEDDTAKVVIISSNNGSAQMDIHTESTFSGYLAC
jgi:hypothetical protein